MKTFIVLGILPGVLLLTAAVAPAQAAAVILRVRPGETAFPPFMFQIESRLIGSRPEGVRFHVRITETGTADVFDQAPVLTLANYSSGQEKDGGKEAGASFVAISQIRSLSVNWGQRTLNCLFTVPASALMNSKLCFEFKHDPGLDIAPHLPSAGPGVVFYLASLREFAPKKRNRNTLGRR